MKHKKILFSSLIMVIAVAAIMTIIQTSYAADATNTNAQNNSNQLNNKFKHSKFGARMDRVGTNDKDFAALEADRSKRRAAVDAALQANNYSAWVQAVGTSSPMLAKINQDNFSKLVQAYQLRKQADTLMAELGLNQGMKNGMMGLHQGR